MRSVWTSAKISLRLPRNRPYMSLALVLSGGGLAGLALVRALRALPGWRVLVADHFDENLTRYEAHGYHVAPPLAQQGAFAHFVLDLVQREGVRVVFPATDHELPALLALRPALAAFGCQAWVSDAAVLDLARSKRAFYSWLQDRGLPVLPFWSDPRAPGVRFPLLGKPDLGWGGRGLVTLPSPPAADAVLEGDWVWQSALCEFDEYSVDLALDAQGRCSPIQPRRRVRVLGGFSMLGEPGAPSQVLALVAPLMQALADIGGRGVFNVQILLEPNGAAWISDLNARVGSSLPLTLAAGLNPLAHLLQAEAPGMEDKAGAATKLAPVAGTRCAGARLQRPAGSGLRPGRHPDRSEGLDPGQVGAHACGTWARVAGLARLARCLDVDHRGGRAGPLLRPLVRASGGGRGPAAALD